MTVDLLCPGLHFYFLPVLGYSTTVFPYYVPTATKVPDDE